MFFVITENVCTVKCVVSTKQAERLQTGLRLRDRNAAMTSKKCLMILVVSTGVNGRWLCYGSRKLPMD